MQAGKKQNKLVKELTFSFLIKAILYKSEET